MKRFFILFTVLSVYMLCPKASYAQWGNHGSHHYYRYHDHPHFGVHVSSFYPNEYYPVLVGGRRYYYDDGLYYDYLGGDYVVASPPLGAVVTTIPSDFQEVVINGKTYYTNNGTYYVYTSSGYKVIAQPSAQTVPIAVGTESIFTLNVPNNTGGYVTVTLRRSGNGFVGPQGEFYSIFPKVSQLQLMYGK